MVETMLFVAVTGLLIAVLLTGWTLMINTQRYKDSVNTFYAFMQSQYNLVYNVENGRDQSLVCNGAIVSENDGIPISQRGQSDCILIGRYVHISEGSIISSFPVVGEDSGTEPEDSSAAAAIRAYNPTVVQQRIGLTEASLEVPWGAEIKGNGPARNDIQNIAIMLLWSPVSGTIHTYIVNAPEGGVPIINQSQINPANENEHVLCLDPGTTVSSGRQAVVIRAFASSQNSVETLGGSENRC